MENASFQGVLACSNLVVRVRSQIYVPTAETGAGAAPTADDSVTASELLTAIQRLQLHDLLFVLSFGDGAAAPTETHTDKFLCCNHRKDEEGCVML